MRPLRLAVLYTALVLGANAAMAQTAADGWASRRAEIASLLSGDMRKLVLPEELGPPLEARIYDAQDGEHLLSDYRGQVLLVNFWATWCVPCRKEMPALDRLQEEMGGDRFSVLTLATGPNPVPAIDRFFEESGIFHLPKLRDPRQQFARQAGVLALPVSVILDAEGREIARLTGEAAWDGPEARAVIAALMTPEG